MKRKLSDIYWLNVAEKNLSWEYIEHTNLVDAKKIKIIILFIYLDILIKKVPLLKKDKDIIGNMIL